MQPCVRGEQTVSGFLICRQVVAFQATLDLMAQQFPGAFTGYKLEVTESHQRQKADTSGTAKAVIGSIAKLGAPISEVRRAPLFNAGSAIGPPHEEQDRNLQ